MINILAYRLLGWYGVRSSIKSCDIVHSVSAEIGIIASRWAKKASKCHVTQVIGSDVNFILPGLKSMRGVQGWEQHLHGVACNSRGLKERFQLLYPGVPNVRTVHRGVDGELFTPRGEKLGPQSQSPPVRFLYLGGFRRGNHVHLSNSVKGGETLLRAWQNAERHLTGHASLVIAGPQSDDEDVVKWKNRLVYPDLVSLAGRLEPRQVPGYIRACDAVVVPSLQEGLPNVCAEAAACGCAVLASRVGGIPEIVVDGQTGVLLPPGDAEALEAALIQYSRAPHVLRDMGHRARAHVERMFRPDAFAIGMIDLYDAAHRLYGGN